MPIYNLTLNSLPGNKPMLCNIYRSEKKEYHYLYLAEDIEFKDLPESLQQIFGQEEEIMRLDLSQTGRLANADIDTVKRDLVEQGFYLQLPPDKTIEEQIVTRVSS
jgi:uncharacterized protein YcgL (UPF0745 family)